MVCPTAKQWRPIDFCSAGYSQHRDLDTHLRWDKRDAPLSSFSLPSSHPFDPRPIVLRLDVPSQHGACQPPRASMELGQ